MMHLYETHLPVANTEIAKDFYTEIVGLRFAYRDPASRHRFLWADSRKRNDRLMGTEHGLWQRKRNVREKCHVAFAVSFDQLLAALKN